MYIYNLVDKIHLSNHNISLKAHTGRSQQKNNSVVIQAKMFEQTFKFHFQQNYSYN